MKKCVDFIRSFYNVGVNGMRLVLFNVMVTIGVVGAVVSILLSGVAVFPMEQMPLLFVTIGVVLFPFYLANYKGKIGVASNFLVVFVDFCLFPILFFLQGGIESGMANWFAFGILFIFLLLEGTNFVIMLLLDAFVIFFCYMVAYYHPQVIRYQMHQDSFYVDVVQSIYITTLAIGLIFKVQNRIRKRQAQLMDEKTKELVEVSQKAKNAQKEAEIANQSKSNFLANMSHEIRTPINTVLGMNEMILRETEEENTRSLAEDIQVSAESLLGIVNEILDFSRIESGKMELIENVYALNSLLHDTMSAFMLRAREKGLYLNINVDENLPVVYYGDSLRIRQILNNIMSNAVKYTKQGGITFSVEGRQEGDSEILHIEIADTGIGMKQEDIHRLFEAFERIDERINRHIEGTGLGMAITSNLLHMMGSNLQVESTYGKGSVFYFDLKQRVMDWTPMGRFDMDERKNYREEQRKRTFLAPEVQILLVDDNSMNRKVFCKLLAHTKVQIDEADSGYSCLELVKKKHYDLIFLDHMMPELDGVETFSYMQGMQENCCRDTPVVVLTANAIIGAKEQYLQIGFDDYLSKPIDAAKLEKVIIEQLSCHGTEVEVLEMTDQGVSKGDCRKEEEFPELEGFDWSYGMLHFPTSEMLWESVEDLYKGSRQATAELDDLYRCIDEENGLDQYRIRVHAVKSNFALVGGMQASALARILEKAADEGKAVLVKRVHPLLMEEFGRCMDVLAPYMEKEKELMADAEWIRGILSMMKISAEDFDYDGIDQMAKVLDTYRYEGSIQPDVDLLQGYAVNMDTEGVLRICEELTNLLSK